MSKKTQTNIFISMNLFGFAMLESLLENGVNISKIFTLDKKNAKGISDYKDFSTLANTHKLPIKFVRNINDHAKEIKQMNPDYIFTFGWSQLVQEQILRSAKLGCVGSHPSLLPKNRGRAAIPWHFINKEKYGGVTFFFLDQGCDDGDIISQRKFVITEKDNAKTYYEKIILLGKEMISKNSDKIKNGKLNRTKQQGRDASYLLIRNKADSMLDFSNQETEQIHNQIRAVAYVYPTAYSYYNGDKISIFESAIVPKKFQVYSAVPGQIIKVQKHSLWVKTLNGIIELKKLRDKNNKSIDLPKHFRVGKRFNQEKEPAI